MCLRCTEALPSGTCMWELREPVAWVDAWDEMNDFQGDVPRDWTACQLLDVLSRVGRIPPYPEPMDMEFVEPVPTTAEGVVRVMAEFYRMRESMARYRQRGRRYRRREGVSPCSLAAPFLDEGPRGSDYERLHRLAWMLHRAVAGTVVLENVRHERPLVWVLPESGDFQIRASVVRLHGRSHIDVHLEGFPGWQASRPARALCFPITPGAIHIRSMHARY